MSEAPKKIWFDREECSAGPVKFNDDEILYIREDVVLELVKALNLALPHLLKDTSSHGKANYWTAKDALAKLEESHD